MRTVHREGNPGDEESQIVVLRSGPAVADLDWPAPA